MWRSTATSPLAGREGQCGILCVFKKRVISDVFIGWCGSMGPCTSPIVHTNGGISWCHPSMLLHHTCRFINTWFQVSKIFENLLWAPTSSANRWHVTRRTCRNPLPTANRSKCVSRKVRLCTCRLLCFRQFVLLGSFVFVRCFIHLLMIAQKQMPTKFHDLYLLEGRKKNTASGTGTKKVYIVSSLQALFFIRPKAHKHFG